MSLTKKQVKTRIAKLRKLINHYRYLYHVLDRQEISDAVLDSLKNELSRLEKEFPEFITPDSPTQRVGGEPLDKFEKVDHRQPMLSIDDVFSEEEIKNWEEYLKRLLEQERGPRTTPTSGRRVRGRQAPPPGPRSTRYSSGRDRLEYFCEVKMDGFAISLLYKNGLFARAATRGDGRVGEDVTNNIKTIESIPLRLAPLAQGKPPTLLNKVLALSEVEVRGEVYMDKKTFERVNREQKKKREKEYANPRNLAAGSVRQLDPKLTASRGLKFMAYDIVGEFGQSKHSEEHEMAHTLGFPTDAYAAACNGLDEVFNFISNIVKKREKLSYNIDGVVISVNDNDFFRKLGVAGKSPRGIRAFKFAAKQATTLIEDITIHVGRTGALTPIAHLRPVNIGGVTISRATLHNQDEIDRLDVRVGDTIIVERAGDVIPDVVSVVKDLRIGKEKKFRIPKSINGHKVVRRAGEAIWYCLTCPERNREYLYFFVSKAGFDIDGLGPKIIDALVENGLVSAPYDIFDLKEGDLAGLKRFAEKSASNIIKAVNYSKKISLARFIRALGIRHVGAETAVDLAQYFGSLEKLKSAKKEEIKSIPDVGAVVAEEVYKWFHDSSSIDFIKKLLARGIDIQKPEATGAKLRGLTFVFTGTLENITRTEAERRVRMFGGDPSGSVSSKTDYVVVGENPGSKYDKAKELGVKIITEEEFLRMI